MLAAANPLWPWRYSSTVTRMSVSKSAMEVVTVNTSCAVVSSCTREIPRNRVRKLRTRVRVNVKHLSAGWQGLVWLVVVVGLMQNCCISAHARLCVFLCVYVCVCVCDEMA